MDTETTYIPYLTDEKIRMAFLFQIPSFWPSWESFYHACLNDSRFDVKLLWLQETTMQNFQIQMIAAEKFLREQNLPYESIDLFDLVSYAPHLVVIQSPYDVWHRTNTSFSLRFKQLGARIVYVPYGIEISDMEDSRILHFYQFTILNAWRIYTFSDKMRIDYVKYCPNRAAVRVLGHPKFDGYIDKSRFALPEIVQSNAAGRNILLWKMHFPALKRDGKHYIQITPCLEEYILFAEWVASHNEFFFIYMPHPLMVGGGANEVFRPQIIKLMAILESAANVYIDYTNDYRNALLNADAIIIDRSALMVEAGITSVPILYMNNRNNTEKLTDAIVPLVESYYQGTTAKDMIDFVEMFQLGQDPKGETRKNAFRECVPFADGKCGIRIADNIAKSIIEERPSPVPRVAIFAIGEIFHYYWETTNVLQSGNIEIVVLSDNNIALHGTQFCGLPIVAPSTLREFDFDAIVIFSEQFYRELFNQLAFEINIDIDKILRLDKFLLWLSSLDGVSV